MWFIRTAHSGDANAIAQLHARSWSENYRGMLSDDYLDNHALAERQTVWQQHLAASNPQQIVKLLFASEHANDLLGFICVVGNAHPQWGTLIDNLHVRQTEKGQGIGRKLMAEAAQWSLENFSSCGMYLKVLEDNLPARQFYAHLGGEEVSSETWQPPLSEPVAERVCFWQNPRHLL